MVNTYWTFLNDLRSKIKERFTVLMLYLHHDKSG